MRCENYHILNASLNFKSCLKNNKLSPIPLIPTGNPCSVSTAVFSLCFRLSFKMNFLLVLTDEGPGSDGHFNLGSLRTTDKYLRVIKDFFSSFSLPRSFSPPWGE